MPFDSSPLPPKHGNTPTPTLPHQGGGSKNTGGEDTENSTLAPPLPTWERGLGGEGKQARLSPSPPNQGNTPTPTLPHQGGGSKNRGGQDTENPTLAPPLPTWERGLGGEGNTEGKPDRWEIPPALREKMKEIARQFRKQPTKSEAILWQAIRNRKLEGRKFRRQQPIGLFVVDFFCANEKLILEVDGLIHESQKILDQQRQELLESLGLRFVRLSSHQVETDLPGALEVIRNALSPLPPKHGNTPTPTLPHQGGGTKNRGGEDTENSTLTPPLPTGERGLGGEGNLKNSKESC